jgi:hypothetical protein
MDAFSQLVEVTRDLEQKTNPGRHLHVGREMLVRAEYHLFHQVSGNNSETPLIEGGYFGKNYSNALQCLANLITSIEVDINLEAIKNGKKPPYRISFKH